MSGIIDYYEGITIKEPCIIRNMPIDIYHKHPALSESGLKTLLNCPAKYYYKYLSGEYEPKEKPSFKIGKACHCYILEGREEFEKRYFYDELSELKKDELLKLATEKLHNLEVDVSEQQLNLFLNAGGQNLKKKTVNELKEFLFRTKNVNNQNKIELTKNELNLIVGTSRAIKANKQASNAFSQKGESELSIFWRDDKTGIWLKCRPDYLPYNCLNIPDYKTTTSVQPYEFFKDFIKYGYHIEAAMYRKGVKAVTNVDVQNFFFIAQEKEAPYITEVFTPDDTLIINGEKAIQAGIEKYLECKQKGIWGTYSNDVIELSCDIKPDDLAGNFDKDNSICYAPFWIDRELIKYED